MNIDRVRLQVKPPFYEINTKSVLAENRSNRQTFLIRRSNNGHLKTLINTDNFSKISFIVYL